MKKVLYIKPEITVTEINESISILADSLNGEGEVYEGNIIGQSNERYDFEEDDDDKSGLWVE